MNSDSDAEEPGPILSGLSVQYPYVYEQGVNIERSWCKYTSGWVRQGQLYPKGVQGKNHKNTNKNVVFLHVPDEHICRVPSKIFEMILGDGIEAMIKILFTDVLTFPHESVIFVTVQ